MINRPLRVCDPDFFNFTLHTDLMTAPSYSNDPEPEREKEQMSQPQEEFISSEETAGNKAEDDQKLPGN